MLWVVPTKAATRCQGVWRCCSRRISYKLEHWPSESNRACHAQEGEKGKLENSSNIKLLLTPSLLLDHPLFLIAITHLPLLNCHFSSRRTRHSHWLQTEPLFTKHNGNAFNSQNSPLHSSVWSLAGGKQGRGICSLWPRSSQFSTQFRKVSDVCPASPHREQASSWKPKMIGSALLKQGAEIQWRGKGNTVNPLGCACTGMGVDVCGCVLLPSLPFPFHLISYKTGRNWRQIKGCGLTFYPSPFCTINS